ncbi:unnamed protein product [Prunus armeniaca]
MKTGPKTVGFELIPATSMVVAGGDGLGCVEEVTPVLSRPVRSVGVGCGGGWEERPDRS